MTTYQTLLPDNIYSFLDHLSELYSAIEKDMHVALLSGEPITVIEKSLQAKYKVGSTTVRNVYHDLKGKHKAIREFRKTQVKDLKSTIRSIKSAIKKRLNKKCITQKEKRMSEILSLSEPSDFIEDLGNEVQLEMIAIPGGSFIMGASEDEFESRDNEMPKHPVNISSFHIGRYPITQAQWREVAELEQVERKLDSDPSHFKNDYEGIDRRERPVEKVSWEEAKEFCARLSKKTGREYRLPTEAEWEYGCRAGTITAFHFGETISTELANYNGNYTYGKGAKGECRGQTTPVGYFKVANNFGLSDMHGNVWEWCEDDWHENYKNAPSDGRAWLSQDSNCKIIRGGSWFNDPVGSRSALRSKDDRDLRVNYIGFRVVCVAPKTT